MQDQPIPERPDTAAYPDEHLDCEVLHLLLSEPGWPWSPEELGREIGDQLSAEDAITRLQASGLVHRCDGLIFPTRTARRAVQLGVGVL